MTRAIPLVILSPVILAAYLLLFAAVIVVGIGWELVGWDEDNCPEWAQMETT